MSKHANRCECGRIKTPGDEACPRCARFETAREHKQLTGVRRRQEFLHLVSTKRAFTRWLAERGLEEI
jgi:hypothetical protein